MQACKWDDHIFSVLNHVANANAIPPSTHINITPEAPGPMVYIIFSTSLVTINKFFRVVFHGFLLLLGREEKVVEQFHPVWGKI